MLMVPQPPPQQGLPGRSLSHSPQGGLWKVPQHSWTGQLMVKTASLPPLPCKGGPIHHAKLLEVVQRHHRYPHCIVLGTSHGAVLQRVLELSGGAKCECTSIDNRMYETQTRCSRGYRSLGEQNWDCRKSELLLSSETRSHLDEPLRACS